MIKSPWDDPETNSKPINNPFKNARVRLNPNGNFDMDYKAVFVALIVVVLLWLSSGVYKVAEGEEGLVLRFGEFVRKAHPGLNYHLPAPIEQVFIERVNKSRRVEIGYRSAMNFVSDTSKYMPMESTMLTGDENIVDLNCDVMWHIKDLENFYFKVSVPEETVKMAAESALREVIGETAITSVLSDKKQEIIDKVTKLTQTILDKYETGVTVEQVQLLKAEPPAEVIDSYRDVQTSKADKERVINQAIAYKNDILPKARGDAAKVLEEANAYKQQVIAQAEGDTSRFLAVLSQYNNAQKVMRDRLYLDTVESVLRDNNVMVIGASALPHLNLNDFNTKLMGDKK